MSSQNRYLAALLISFGFSTACVHATQTRSEEEREDKSGKQAKKDKPKTTDKKRGAQKRSETMETSKTTAQMFKPGGIKKLQAALDDAVRDIDQNDVDKEREKNPPLGAQGKREDKRDDKKPKNEKEVLAQKDEARKKELTKKIEFVNETGRFDERTQLALMLYQKAEGLPETGLPDYETLRRLGLEPDEILYHEVPAERLGVP